MTPLERITQRVNRNGDVNDPKTPRPLLTLAEFFEGNHVVGSIGCNLMPTPQPAEFHEMLRRGAAPGIAWRIISLIAHLQSKLNQLPCQTT